jgi:hypothetical protein
MEHFVRSVPHVPNYPKSNEARRTLKQLVNVDDEDPHDVSAAQPNADPTDRPHH